MQKTEVLIIGAGPTGLVLALWLTKAGVKVRIVDKAAKPGTTSRAIVIHARNLEFYQQLGIAHIAVEKGVEIKAGNLWVRGKKAGRVPLSDLKVKISPYQFLLGFPQDQQEEMLENELAKLGVKVERSTELISFKQLEGGIRAELKNSGGTTGQCDATYLAGCDGARSNIREQLGVGFPGGTYAETFYVADLKAKGLIEQGEVNIALDDADFLAIFPLQGSDSIRLVGTIRPEAMNNKELKWEDVSEGIIRRLKIEVEKVNWFSTYRVHHRVASHFRSENVFLAGDAGHIHSPVGGQGMNTGIGDAVNLAWKLAAVIKDKAPAAILDTFEPERISFARRLVATTDSAFTFVSSRGPFAAWIRMHLAPLLLPVLFRFEPVRRFMFLNLSQTAINYRHSDLSVGTAGKIKGGDRLPWVMNHDGSDNFTCLNIMKWQVHIYGDNSPSIQELCDKREIKLHVFEWSEAAKDAGLKKNATYILRPDGYVGMNEPDSDVPKIIAYFDKWNVGTTT
jgi:2-polyprenyl-6-methoxyphenol hydroxylase-like FAD-dependent oxidoreductase